MDLQLSGKRVVITGGSKGIGFGCAEVLAGEGCDLVLVARGAEDLKRAEDDLKRRYSVGVEVIVGDLSTEDGVADIASRLEGAVDVLVNNAGVIPLGDLESTSLEDWRKSNDLKVFGCISMTQKMYRRMKEAGSGVIVNVIGNSAEHPHVNLIASSTICASLAAFTKTLGKQGPTDGIRVVGVNPGPVATERWVSRRRQIALERTGDSESWKEMLKGMPFGRTATPEDIGYAVAFLASPRSSYTSGTVLTVDGGQ